MATDLYVVLYVDTNRGAPENHHLLGVTTTYHRATNLLLAHWISEYGAPPSGLLTSSTQPDAVMDDDEECYFYGEDFGDTDWFAIYKKPLDSSTEQSVVGGVGKRS